MGHFDGEHSHSHGGEVHSHTHSHTGRGTPAAAAPVQPETVKLLEYMIDHNDHHADELAGLLEQLPEKAQGKLMRAIGSFEAANVELREVLDCLKETE